MSVTNVLGQNFEVDTIFPDLMVEAMEEWGKDPLIEALPLTSVNFDWIRWEQWENAYGLLATSALGTDPHIAPVPGYRQYQIAPGDYRERAMYDETEMVVGREPGTPNLPSDPKERIAIIQMYQAQKSVARIRDTISSFLLTGSFRNTNTAGTVVHADTIANYRTFAPANDGPTGPGWAADPINARPLNDLRYWQNLLQIGTSSRFGQGSKLLCQTSVVNDLLACRDVKEKYRSEYGATINGPKDLEKLMVGFGLPPLEVYDHGYYPLLSDAVNRTTANFVRHLPVKSLIWIGTRPSGQKIGNFVFTRHPGKIALGHTGAFNVSDGGEGDWTEGLFVQSWFHNRLPFRYEVDVAFRGGPRMNFGSACAGLSYT